MGLKAMEVSKSISVGHRAIEGAILERPERNLLRSQRRGLTALSKASPGCFSSLWVRWGLLPGLAVSELRYSHHGLNHYCPFICEVDSPSLQPSVHTTSGHRELQT